MYYRINHSLDPNIIVNVSQQFEKSEYPVPIDNPNYIGNFWLEPVDIRKIIVPVPILFAKAKLTDFINGTWYGCTGRLLISNNLKEILEKQGHVGLQFINTSLLHKGNRIENYWFTNPYSFNESAIDFRKSKFF